MIHTIIRAIKRAGAKSEDASEDDGAFSYHAESHSAALGLAAGFLLVATGQKRLLGIVYAAAVAGKARGMDESQRRRRIVQDVVQEPHYALAGVMVGAVIGAVVRVVQGQPLPSIPVPV